MKEPKTGKLFCVNCNMYAIPESEFDPSKHTLAQPNSQNGNQQNTASTTNSASDPVTRMNDTEKSRFESGEKDSRPRSA